LSAAPPPRGKYKVKISKILGQEGREGGGKWAASIQVVSQPGSSAAG